MSDLISRSALIEAMEKRYQVAEKKAFYSVGLSEGFIVCEEIIKEQPTVEAKPVGWIPCSEKLPEDETLLYWTTHEDGSLVLHGYKKRNGFICNWEVDDLDKRKRQGQVIAWIPIFEPAPYNADMRKKVE